MYTITTEIKHLSSGTRFKIRGQKTICTFIADHRTFYTYKKGNRVIESAYYNMIVDAIY